MLPRTSTTNGHSGKGSELSVRSKPSSDAGEVSLGDVRVSELGSDANGGGVSDISEDANGGGVSDISKEAKDVTSKKSGGSGFFGKKSKKAKDPDAPGGGNDLAAVAKVGDNLD